jgi:hypothetical protein
MVKETTKGLYLKQLKIKGPSFLRHNVSIPVTTKTRQRPTGSLSKIFFSFIFPSLFVCSDDYCNQQSVFHLKLITIHRNINTVPCLFKNLIIWVIPTDNNLST